MTIMNGMTDLFEKEGNRLDIEGNKPLLLTDPGSVWVVGQEKASVFSVQIKDDGSLGARRFLFEVNAGEILFGISPAGDGQKFGLLVSGLPGTRLLQISREKFLGMIRQVPDETVFIRGLSNWAGALAKCAGLAAAPVIQLTPSTAEVIWVGRLVKDDRLMTLEDFHGLVLKEIVKQRLNQRQADRLRFQEKRLHDRGFLENALKRLVSIAQPEQEEVAPEEMAGDPLLAACRLVGKAMKIEILPPSKTLKGKDPLDDIARASQIRVRQVALKGEWFRQDNGPMLAYLEKDNRPVALIPLSPFQYQMHDPAGKTKTLVDFQVAGQIKPFAVTFYRPFPRKALKLRDILAFGLGSAGRRDSVIIILMGLMGGLLNMVIPIATGLVFDTIVPGGEKAQLLQIAFFLGAAALSGLLFQLTRSLAMLRLGVRMEGAVQAAVWDRLLGLPVTFFKNYSSGELAMRAMGVTQIWKLLSGAVATTILTSLFSFFNYGLLFYYDTRLALMATILIVVFLAVMVILRSRQLRYERLEIDISNKIAGFVLQVIGGISKFRVSGAEKRAFYLISRDYGEQKRTNIKKRNESNLLITFNSFFPIVTSLVIFYAASSSTSLGAGKFVAFNAALVSFISAITILSQSLLSVNAIIPLYEKIRPILEELPEFDEDGADPGQLTGSIEVSHVSFRYKEDGPIILDDVSLQIREGEYVGLVGPSGSGKSTLLRVLLGFEKPGAGQVFYNGQALDKLDIRFVRKQLGVVLQDGKLMPGSIFSNILGANLHLTVDDAWAAAKMAGFDRDIRDMPMGIHTIISEGAGTLSGGQRQRLMIARAIVNNPQIILFDEATSALDNRTQAIVGESLERLKATRIVIAHRLSTVAKCERIFVMDKGKIIESGTYKQLLEMGGMFAELARRQLA